MPVKRDVRVPHASADDAPPKPVDVAGSRAAAGLVTVMGFDSKDVLFRSDRVGTVQWRDSKGEITALLIRLKPDIWGFCHKGEDDWPEMLDKYGNPDAT